ncbi:F0F1 ATP synthase subunit gamma, partial [Patescibacteria group bacterium]
MAQTRDIKRRIRSVTNTKKITKAMEMVAAAKMRKAVAAVLASRDYARQAWNVVLHLAQKTDPAHHPLLTKRPVKKIGLLLISANRGLVGGFNSQMVKAAHEYAKKMKNEQQAESEI